MTCVVTGAAGFLGSHLCQRLPAESVSMLKALETIEKTLGASLRICHLAALPGESRANDADISRARRLLQYIPAYTFRKGLSEQIFSAQAASSRGRAATARADP
jgi:nucleoside-diphosphate-sugar epimerase